MKLFQCQNCGNVIHFDNTACVSCGMRLGYLPESGELSALTPADGGWRPLAAPERAYISCDNAAYEACNWLVPAESGRTVCEACRHNHMVPDLTVPQNLSAWRKLEGAKHHLFYSLLRWHLPAPDRIEDPTHGLAFDFLADATAPAGGPAHVLTGHDDGLITINIAEADDAEREKRRTAMGEPYRTLLGHFRHEVGHYYWDVLVRDGGRLEDFRALFGDETQDYAAALQAHYENGPPADWQSAFISTYATSHPWEDFAETWAHYLHMVDALETAGSFGLRLRPRVPNAAELQAEVTFSPYKATDLAALIEAFVPLTVAMNAINRSMGQPDLYPFVLNAPVIEKLQFIHEIVSQHRDGANVQVTTPAEQIIETIEQQA